MMIDMHDLGGWALDWLCIGWNDEKNRAEAIMIEVKPDEDAPFTAQEKGTLAAWPDVTMVAYCLEDVLRRYGRLK